MRGVTIGFQAHKCWRLNACAPSKPRYDIIISFFSFFNSVQRGFTPLHIAARYGNLKVARLLISNGADVNYGAKVCQPFKLYFYSNYRLRIGEIPIMSYV